MPRIDTSQNHAKGFAMSAQVIAVPVEPNQSATQIAAAVQAAMSQLIGEGYQIVSVVPLRRMGRDTSILVCGQTAGSGQ